MSRSPDATPRQALDGVASLQHFRCVTRRLALTDGQQVAIDQAVSQLQPVMVQLQRELNEIQQVLAALHPENEGYLEVTGRLSNDIGTLAAQIALTSSQLKSRIYTVLNIEQQGLMSELRAAFQLYE